MPATADAIPAAAVGGGPSAARVLSTAAAAPRKRFLTTVNGVAPWGLGSDVLDEWLKIQLEATWSTIDWSKLLDALRGLEGIDLLTRCEPIARPPWVKLRKGRNNEPLTKQGVKMGQLGNLGMLLNKHGIGFYSVLLQSCDRLSPLTDLVWRKKLGEGGFGQVYLAKNKHRSSSTFGALSAVKLIKCEDESKLHKASKEMQHHQKAAVASEFVVNILTWGQIPDEFLFIEMEFCAGGDARKLLLDASVDPPRKHGMADGVLR